MTPIRQKPPVKICGLTTLSSVQAAVGAGADFLGFVFYPPSLRHVTYEAAKDLIQNVPKDVKCVGLFVNPNNETLKKSLTPGLHFIQLHGDETPARVEKIKDITGLPVIKSIAIGAQSDLARARAYEDTADWLLFDTKPPADGLPGGTGQVFDWSILAGRTFSKPWMLAGGLTAGNVGKALSVLTPDAVDVSSGVEHPRGVKNDQKIKTFIQAVTCASELFQTYTETGLPLDLVPRSIVHRKGLWHRAANVFLFRSDGRLVLQRRSKSKAICPGAWDLSAAEHLMPGETYQEAAQRGLAEELSIHDVEMKSFGDEMRCMFENEQIKDYEFQQCFSVVSDKDISIDEAEVSDVDLYTLPELKQAMHKTPEIFTPWFIQAAEHVKLFQT